MSALPTLWTVRTADGARSCRRDGDRFVTARTPWVKERWALLSMFAGNDFRARYRAQALGVLWSLLQPLVMMAILSVVFTFLRSTEPNFPVFLLIGLVVWQWVASALAAATISYVANADMVKRTVFPRELLPMASVLSYGMNAAIESLALLALIPFFPGALVVSRALLVVPILLALLAVLIAFASLAFAALNVIYRDVAYLVTTGLSILYWLTPVVYPPSILPARWYHVFAWNPLFGIVTGLRGALMHELVPTAQEWLRLGVVTTLVVVIGVFLFRRHERDMLDHV